MDSSPPLLWKRVFQLIVLLGVAVLLSTPALANREAGGKRAYDNALNLGKVLDNNPALKEGYESSLQKPAQPGQDQQQDGQFAHASNNQMQEYAKQDIQTNATAQETMAGQGMAGYSEGNYGISGAASGQFVLNSQKLNAKIPVANPEDIMGGLLAAGDSSSGTFSIGGGGGSILGSFLQSVLTPASGPPGNKQSGCGAAYAGGTSTSADAQSKACPDGKCNAAKSNSQEKQASRASSAGEDALENLYFAIEDYGQFLINVANEDAGAGGGSMSPTKTYAQVVGMVQKMYKTTYLPLAFLFLLPGALITNTKTLVSFGMLGTRDDDTSSPFAGIFRSVIAVFLIPATQLAVSYMIDVGNALESCVLKYVSMPTILIWVQEQVVVLDAKQQGGPIMNLPNIPMAPYRGKFAGMPIEGMIMQQVSGLDAALMELCNETFHMLTMAMTVMSAFQIATICYLFLVGPLVAAFFAWPGVGRELFRRAFSSWLDGVVIVSLWKFWWNIVLACWTIWIQTSGNNPFDPFNAYYMIAFLCILMSVPFNPFEFKPSEIVGSVLMKAEAVAAKVGQAGKGGGSGGGGKSKGGGGGGGGGGG